MFAWQGDLIESVGDPALSTNAVFERIQTAARALGFEYTCYGIKIPMPAGAPEVLIFENYPAGWMQRYASKRYVEIDPSVREASISQAPVLWEQLSDREPQFWEDARGYGLRHGWAQSTFDGTGTAGLLSLSRSNEAIRQSELRHQGIRLQWLGSLSHAALFHRMRGEITARMRDRLTARETEILKWSAGGKTNDEVGDILNLSTDTVKFHVKNAIRKLNCVNKTQAAARAAMLGLLS